jgi:hypothetical protein
MKSILWNGKCSRTPSLEIFTSHPHPIKEGLHPSLPSFALFLFLFSIFFFLFPLSLFLSFFFSLYLPSYSETTCRTFLCFCSFSFPVLFLMFLHLHSFSPLFFFFYLFSSFFSVLFDSCSLCHFLFLFSFFSPHSTTFSFINLFSLPIFSFSAIFPASLVFSLFPSSSTFSGSLPSSLLIFSLSFSILFDSFDLSPPLYTSLFIFFFLAFFLSLSFFNSRILHLSPHLSVPKHFQSLYFNQFLLM